MTDDKPKISPSRWWYLAGVLIWIGGCAGSLGIGLSQAASKVESMDRVVVPGETTLDLAAGDYTGFYEAKSVVDGASYATADSVTGVRCGMMNADTGTAVEIRPATSSTTYSFGSYSGASMFVFTIATAGSYRFGCEHDSGPIVIAIGHGVGKMIVVIIAAALGAFVIGAIVIVVIFRKRRRASA